MPIIETEKPVVYCQNCRHANYLREPLCVKCGTRLMIVVFPESLQYDTNAVPSYYEDHLLERVSSLEIKLAQVIGKLENAYRFIQTGFDGFAKDRLILESFLETVHQLNPEIALAISGKSLEKFAAVQTADSPQEGKNFLKQILAEHPHPNSGIFEKLVRDGIEMLERGDEKESFQMLERAALLSPQNFSLLWFIALRSFEAEKQRETGKYLDKLQKLEPQNICLNLFSAALLADERDFAKSKKLLKYADKSQRLTKAVKCLKGFISAADGNWEKAAKFFGQNFSYENSAEIAYLLGCVYFQLNADEKSLEFLTRAVLLDPQFSDAWFMQAVIYRKQKNDELCRAALVKTAEIKENGAQSVEYLKKGKSLDISIALPFAHFQDENKRLWSGGSMRISKFVRRLMAAAFSVDD